MRCIGVLGLSLAALALSGPAPAATTPYFHAGRWVAFGGRIDQNRLVCGMSTDNPTDGRRFDIESVIGTPGLRFVASRPTWEIPANTPIPIVMRLAGQAPWTLQGTGNGHEVVWTLDQAGEQSFLPAFRAGSTLDLSFPSGSEPPWEMLLAGSNDVGGTFLRCVSTYTAAAQAHAQQSQAAPQPAAPQPAATATQPFGAPTTQPFTPAVKSTPLGVPPGPDMPPLPALPPLPHANGQ